MSIPYLTRLHAYHKMVRELPAIEKELEQEWRTHKSFTRYMEYQSEDGSDVFAEEYTGALGRALKLQDLLLEYTNLISILQNWKGGPIERRTPAMLAWWRAHH